MKPFLLIIVLLLPLGIFAQGPNTNINVQQVIYSNLNRMLPSNNSAQIQTVAQNPVSGTGGKTQKPCDDCAEVKAAIKASKSFSSGIYVGRKFSWKAWHHKISGRANMKFKKMFSHRKKIHSRYDMCFNWK